ncbi:hypothetical protein MTR_7g090610 [Medicago truncatula]|uniref:SWIM-type domain-containing protein n=1 Tax=Medicago truncatula TaxID=3880 RepID=G7KRR9_MEDTR|nr:hypothetical protein MTR_7g090610 [Medicago truncatula]
MSEAFNSTIVIPRQKPIVTMCEDIRVYLIEKWDANRTKIASYEDDVLPNIKKRIARESAYTSNWLVRRSTKFDFEVRHVSGTGYKYHVNLQMWVCDCRKWLLTALPCCHDISCMRNQDLNVYDFVPDIYKNDKYVACYSSVIYPPPAIRKQPGRPKKKRNKEARELVKDDTQMRRARWGMKCSSCRQSGHNKSTCKLPPPLTTEGSSNPTSGEGSSTQTAQVNSQPQPSSQGAQTTQVTGTTHPSTQRVARRQPTTQKTQPTDQRNAASQPAQDVATEGAQTHMNPATHTQRNAATQPSQRPTTSQSNASNQRTQGAQADGGPKRKRKEKQQVSATQPEGSNAKKKKTSARVEGSASTQQ